MASPPLLAEVIAALDAAMDWSSGPELRKNATAFLEQVKAADGRTAVQMGMALVESERADHVRLFGVQLLQISSLSHWSEFSAEEHRQLTKLAFDLLVASTGPDVDRSLRSKAAALLADVVRQEGPSLWEQLLPTLVTMSSSSPTHAEAAALVLQFLPEDITVHNQDLDGVQRREWLTSLTAALPRVLPFLRSVLESSFTSALGAVQQGDFAAGRSYAAAVSAALASAGAYAEWAPVSALGSAKLVDACGYLLNAPEFRTAACDFLKLLAVRRRQQEDPDAFDSAMSSLFTFTISALRNSLQQLGPAAPASSTAPSDSPPDYDISEAEFAQSLCEVFSALTPTNLQRLAIKDTTVMPQLLQVLLQLFSHTIFTLHAESLPLWIILLRESAVASGTPVGYQHGIRAPKTDSAVRDTRSHWCIVPADHCVVLLEVVVRHLQESALGQGPAHSDDDLLATTSLTEYTQYRSRLIEVIRLVAAQQPLAAVRKACAMLDAALAMTSQGATVDTKIVASAEAAQTFLECTLGGILEATMSASASSSTSLGTPADELSLLVEGVLKKLLDINWPSSNGMLIELHAHLLDSLAPYCRHNPTAAGLVASRLFGLIHWLPPVAMGAEPLGRPEKAEDRLPRLQVCTSILRLCRTAAPALTAHLKTMVDSVAQLAEEAKRKRGQDLPITGETILMGEALISVAAASGPEEEVMVLEWLFAPVRQQWTNRQWQERAMGDAASFARLLAHNPNTAEAADFWFLFHSLMLFERSMRRPPSVPVTLSTSHPHPAAAHLCWILPPLLQVVRWIHALWRPEVRGCLPSPEAEALEVGAYEQAVVLGLNAPGATPSPSEASPSGTPSSSSSTGKTAIITKRNWLKGLRDNAYGFLGLAATNAPASFFNLPTSIPELLQTSLLESLSSMEQRHLRLLLKLVLGPIARCCPRDRWHLWISPSFPPVLQHCGRSLSLAWASKSPSSGTPQPAPAGSSTTGAAMRDEMFQDKILRDLSREFCALLSALPRLPSLAPGGSSPQQQLQSVGGAGAGAGVPLGNPPAGALETPGRPDSMFWFMLYQQPDATLATLGAGMEAMDWADSEAALKAILFCSGVCAMPELLYNTSTTLGIPTQGGIGMPGGIQTQGGIDLSVQQQLFGCLREAVGRSMFAASCSSLTLESNASSQAEILGLLRDIYFRLAISGISSAPKEVLLSLPGMTPASLDSLEASLKRSGSAKEQRAVFKQLLLGLGGDKLRALAAQRNTTTITNVSGYVRKLSHDAKVAGQGPGSFLESLEPTVGLATILPTTEN